MELNYWHIGENNAGCINEQDWLRHNYLKKIETLKYSSHLNQVTLKSQSYIKVKHLIKHAYNNTFSYRNKFSQACVSPEDFKSIDDIRKFPVLEKQDFWKFDKTDYIAKNHVAEKLFRTQTCGTTSGRKHYVYFDKEAILNDSLQAAQQLILQSDPKQQIDESDLTVHFYINPWWSDSINGSWKTEYISSDILPVKAAHKIKELNPSVLAGYPSDLRRLMKHIKPGDLALKLVITNSEFSTRAERNLISAHFGCEVRDEYSSEELTRIALEMPDGGYYVNEDSVYVEVLDPVTRQPVPDGKWGEAVITGLLNKAMPYIRYATGDWVKKTPEAQLPEYKTINWQRLNAIGGRIIDSLVTTEGEIVPQNIILDKLDTRAIEEIDHISDYRIYQKSLNNITIAVRRSSSANLNNVADFIKFAKLCLHQELGSSIKFNIIKTRKSMFDLDNRITNMPRSARRGKKRRRIRFLGDIKKYMKTSHKDIMVPPELNDISFDNAEHPQFS